MTFRPRQSETDIYPEDEYNYSFDEYEPDPDHQRDLQMEREWTEDTLLDDPSPDLMWQPKGGYVDKYMAAVYGQGPL